MLLSGSTGFSHMPMCENTVRSPWGHRSFSGNVIKSSCWNMATFSELKSLRASGGARVGPSLPLRTPSPSGRLAAPTACVHAPRQGATEWLQDTLSGFQTGAPTQGTRAPSPGVSGWHRGHRQVEAGGYSPRSGPGTCTLMSAVPKVRTGSKQTQSSSRTREDTIKPDVHAEAGGHRMAAGASTPRGTGDGRASWRGGSSEWFGLCFTAIASASRTVFTQQMLQDN